MSHDYITTPIYYVNDRPHIGHSYTTLLADVAARYARLRRGQPAIPDPDAGPNAGPGNVFFLTGTDEHAEKVVESAKAHGTTPQDWADRNAAEFKKAFQTLGFTNNDFVRTSEQRHTSRAAAFIARLLEQGDIELGDYEGWWDASQEEYVPENVAREHEFKSPVTGRELEKRTEQNYFFKLTRHAEWLQTEIESDRIRVLPDARKNEVLGRIRQGLRDVPVSRRVGDNEDEAQSAWGIRMPGDDGHRVYVWIEALCNYLTVVDTPDRRRFWPATVHVMAKDILWFHAVIWPCMLRALGEAPPALVYAHAYWIREGRKMSKSLGNFIEIETLEAYADKFSLDALRWYMLTQGPLGATDADFVHGRFVEVYNNDLANGFGNSASRVTNMVDKYFAGTLPRECNGEFGFPDGKALQLALKAREAAGKPVDDPSRTFDFPKITAAALAEADRAFEAFELDALAMAGLSIVRAVDEFISYSAPFTLAKRLGDFEHAEKALATMLYSCAEALRIAAVLLMPVLPEKTAELLRSWNAEPMRGVPLVELCVFNGEHALRKGQTLAKGDALFMRADPSDEPPA
ncbi:MAG: class I tRNA ligase family protein [Planctomycetota bacterium]